jgi:GxxExxY protein
MNNTRTVEQIGKFVLDAAFKVHTVLGPGLLESVYEAALAMELGKQKLNVERQKPIAVHYDGVLLDAAFRADMIVENAVLVELKSVEQITPTFKKIVTNYLRCIPLQLGYLINFNEAHLKNGIVRVVNGLEGKEFFGRPEEIDLHGSSRPSLPLQPSREISAQ